MPVNEYQCVECGLKFEKVRRFKEPHPDECDWPFCTGQLRQVYHSFVFRMRKGRSYSAESSTGAEKHMAAQVSAGELVR